MSGKAWRAAGVVFAVLLVAAWAVIPASAQSMGPTYYTLNPGQTAEWVLSYNGSDNSATVEVGASPQGSVGFNVFTNQQWINANTAMPIGKGTEWKKFDTSSGNSIVQNSGNLMWQTGQAAPETYHIQVYSTSNQPTHYFVTATGGGVAGIAPYAPQMPATTQLAQAQTGTTTAQTGAMAQAKTGTTTAQTGAVAMAQTGTTASTSPAPRTLPVTGGQGLELLLGAGAALVAAGWLARRRTA